MGSGNTCAGGVGGIWSGGNTRVAFAGFASSVNHDGPAVWSAGSRGADGLRRSVPDCSTIGACVAGCCCCGNGCDAGLLAICVLSASLKIPVNQSGSSFTEAFPAAAGDCCAGGTGGGGL